ncbi:spore coat CotO family protein, partial [Bacillus tianshenii]|uniref:CotO family spore coat protein n=1 Tax=Sutcliffiella tianshenii TaxID=1463404 RepID=UPI001CD3E30D
LQLAQEETVVMEELVDQEEQVVQPVVEEEQEEELQLAQEEAEVEEMEEHVDQEEQVVQLAVEEEQEEELQLAQEKAEVEEMEELVDQEEQVVQPAVEEEQEAEEEEEEGEMEELAAQQVMEMEQEVEIQPVQLEILSENQKDSNTFTEFNLEEVLRNLINGDGVENGEEIQEAAVSNHPYYEVETDVNENNTNEETFLSNEFVIIEDLIADAQASDLEIVPQHTVPEIEEMEISTEKSEVPSPQAAIPDEMPEVEAEQEVKPEKQIWNNLNRPYGIIKREVYSPTFYDLDITDKIDYLTSLPKYINHVLIEVKLHKRLYVGKIYSYQREEGTIYLLNTNRLIMNKLEIKDILAIKVISL